MKSNTFKISDSSISLSFLIKSIIFKTWTIQIVPDEGKFGPQILTLLGRRKHKASFFFIEKFLRSLSDKELLLLYSPTFLVISLAIEPS